MSLMLQLQPYMSLVHKCPLLKGVPEEQYEAAFACIGARVLKVPKDSSLLSLGDSFRYAYYLLEGSLVSTFQTATFDQITLKLFWPGDLLGESFACIPGSISTIQLSAACDSVCLQFDLQPLLGQGQCGGCCVSPYHHHIMLVNLLANMAHTNAFLNEKVRILSQKGVRDRILIYFASLPASSKGVVTLPFSKTKMAEFLGVNRSAMSRELHRMEEDGLIQVTGRRIRLLQFSSSLGR